MEDVAIASLVACAIGLVIIAKTHVQAALVAGAMVIACLWWLKQTKPTKPPPDLVGFEETKHGSTEPLAEDRTLDLFFQDLAWTMYRPRHQEPIVMHYAAVWRVPRRRRRRGDSKCHRGIEISPPIRDVD